MNIERGKIEGEETPEQAAAADRRIEAAVAAMKQEPIGSDPGRRVDAAMIARARAGLAGGEGVEHAVVAEWLDTWGTSDRRPFKEWLAAWHG